VEDIGLASALQSLHRVAPQDLPDAVSRIAGRMGAYDLIAYLVDFEQSTLFPLPDRGPHVDTPVAVPIEGTPEGSAFLERRVIAIPSGDTHRVYAPIIEGSDVTGVLALSVVGPADDRGRHLCAQLGLLVGSAVSVAARATDHFNVVRRRRAMSLPASIQWDLLPPLRLTAPGVSSEGVLEPAYDVGGDCFDHSVNGSTVDLAIMDAMGHGLDSSVASSLAVSSYRHGRREGRPLSVLHRRIDGVLADQFGGQRFVTGQLARLDLLTGRLAWINAGHPLPLHLRDGTVLATLACRPTLPWGLGGTLREEAAVDLEPGDSVVFFTDGAFEGRTPAGEPFGMDRFVELVERTASGRRPTGVDLRSCVREVLDHQANDLRDDATILWLDWTPEG